MYTKKTTWFFVATFLVFSLHSRIETAIPSPNETGVVEQEPVSVDTSVDSQPAIARQSN